MSLIGFQIPIVRERRERDTRVDIVVINYEYDYVVQCLHANSPLLCLSLARGLLLERDYYRMVICIQSMFPPKPVSRPNERTITVEWTTRKWTISVEALYPFTFTFW